MLVYSKQPLGNARVEFFGTERNASVIAQLAIAAQPVTLLATHPLPPAKPSFFQSRNQQLARISEYLATLENQIILAGDLNTTMWSPYYRRLAQRTGLHNAREGFGILPTWPTPGTYRRLPGWLTLLLSIPIDHCLLSQGLEAVNVYTGSHIDSDHRPLLVDIRARPAT